MTPRVVLCSTEASGDRLATLLVAALREARPTLPVGVLAGSGFSGEGVQRIGDGDGIGVIGFVDSVRAAGRALRAFHAVRGALARWKPDVLVTVDSPAFMFRLAQVARGMGVRTLHWVAPQTWARTRPRVSNGVDTVACLFPWEPEIWRKFGVRSIFSGHPAAWLDSYGGVRDGIAVVPGSRRSEIRRLWPLMASVVEPMRDSGLPIYVPVAPGVDPGAFQAWGATTVGSVANAGRRSQGALVCSGTATLELAAVGCPMVVTYRLDPVSFSLAKRFVSTSHIALPNLLAKESLVPEFIQTLDPIAIRQALNVQMGRDEDFRERLRDTVSTLRASAPPERMVAREVLRWVPAPGA